MSADRFFSGHYAEARHKFLGAVAVADLGVETFRHPECTGPHGEELCVDVTRQGAEPGEAHTVILTCSAVHGVEGYVGSAGQVATLTYGVFSVLPPGVAVVHVHALNPYGFSHDRRVNEDNVDLNRNFIDFNAPRPPEHPLTAEVMPLLLPEDWEGGKADMDRQVDALVVQHGLRAVQCAITQGQYRLPESVYFGGAGPVWSNRVWREILARHCRGAKHVLHIDLHSGLGPYGYGELIFSDPPETPALARARAIWGDRVTCSRGIDSSSVPLTGETEWAVKDEVGFDAVTSVTLEFGTVPVPDILEAMIGDNWLYQRGAIDTPLAARLKRHIRYAFYGEEPVWRRLTVECCLDVMQQALNGVTP